MRDKRLDILRAIAILLVLGRHGSGPTLWKNAGWVGVDLFFVLSGFLISGLLFTEYKKTTAINWKRFFIRRGFKIYPAFYVMILATFLWRVVQHQENPWGPYLPEIFFYQSYQSYRMWPHTWSLAVEEHFYILLPALLLLLVRVNRKVAGGDPFRIIPAVCAILALYCLLLRTYLAYTLLPGEHRMLMVFYPTHLRIDALFFGVLLGYLHHFHAGVLKRVTTGLRWRLTLFAVSAVLVSTCIVFPADGTFMLAFGLTALYLGFGGVLILTLYRQSGESGELPSWLRRFKIGKLTAYVGMHSYSIYLWHLMVTQHFRDFLRLLWPRVGDMTLFWGHVLISLIVGVVLSNLIEFPALRLRDRLFPAIASVRK